MMVMMMSMRMRMTLMMTMRTIDLAGLLLDAAVRGVGPTVLNKTVWVGCGVLPVWGGRGAERVLGVRGAVEGGVRLEH